MDKLKLWILAGALAVVPAVMAVVRLRRRRKAEAGKEAQQAPQTPEKGLPQPDPVITVGIQKYADRFMGLYSGVCAAQQEVPATGDSYREWCLRMEGLREDEGFYDAFFRNFPRDGGTPEQLRLLAACVYAAGIAPDERKSVVADHMTQEQYRYLGSGLLTAGCRYRVLMPCWCQDGRIVEQGVLIDEEA